MTAPRSIDAVQATRFLQSLDSGTEHFVFQTFDDSKSRKNGKLARILTGSLRQLLPTLNGLQRQGAGVFVQVQAGPDRGKRNITGGRAVFVDADQPEKLAEIIPHLKTHMPQPSVVVKSSAAGKMHFYWAVTGLPPEEIADIQDLAADLAGTDAAMGNPDRVMRLPGSWHQKDNVEPFQVKLLVCTDQRYPAEELYHGMMQAPKRGAIRPATGESRELFDPVFGLPIQSAYEEISSLPEGGRTQPLVSHIGKLISQGYSAAYVEAEIREMARTLVPEGHAPISEEALQQEILPAIGRFEQTRQEEAYGEYQQPGPSAPPTPVPGLPGYEAGPTPPPVPTAQPQSLQPVDTINQTLDVWESIYVYVEEGQQIIDTTKPLESGRYRAADFEKSRKNCKAGQAQMYNKWLSSPRRKTVRDLTFMPGSGELVSRAEATYLNTYSPPTPLTEEFDPGMMDVFEDQLAWMFVDVDAWDRMVKWTAFTLQRPETRIPWTPLLVSAQGTGKTWLFEVVKAMHDGKYCVAVEPDDLDQSYNSYMADTTVVWFEEVRTRNRHEMIDKLKTIITNKTLEINNKYGAKGQREIFANVGMTSNHDDALALTVEDLRRYWVYRITRPMLPPAAAARIYTWVDHSNGPKHAMTALRKIDLRGWAFNAQPPMTPATHAMIRASMSLMTRAMVEGVEDRLGVFAAELGDERQVEHTVAQFLDQDLLDKKQKSELQHLLRHHTTAMRRVFDNGRLVRLMCWRRPEFWQEQSDTKIIEEYNRAKAADLGQPIGNTNLKAIDGSKQ